MSEVNQEGQTPKEEGRVIVNQYFGPDRLQQRTVTDYRFEILNFAKLNFYREILDLADKAKGEGRDELVLLDFGSGVANLGKQLGGGKVSGWNPQKSETDEFNRFKKELEEKGIRVIYIGLTDAKEKEQQGEILWGKEEGCWKAQNYAYTVTRGQTVEKFLKKLGLGKDSLDMVLAVHSLCYLTLKNFEETIRDILQCLRPGGVLIGVNLDPLYLLYRGKVPPRNLRSLQETYPSFDFSKLVSERVNFLREFSTDYDVSIFESGGFLNAAVIRKK